MDGELVMVVSYQEMQFPGQGQKLFLYLWMLQLLYMLKVSLLKSKKGKWLVSFFNKCNALGFNSVIYFYFMSFPLVLIQLFTFIDVILDIFYPFVGYREVRLVSKEFKHRGGEPLILCFVDFANPACAATTMSALQ
ncbi:hypothetical protein HN51_001368, partial [Arachis hypogaea]